VKNKEGVSVEGETTCPLPIQNSSLNPFLEKPPFYSVKKGDSLGTIAKEVYGDINLWGLLYLINKDSVTVPEKLRSGIKLRVPPKDALAQSGKYSFAKFKQAYPRE